MVHNPTIATSNGTLKLGMWNVVHKLIIATTNETLKQGMWTVECGAQSDHCDNKLNTEARNVKCGTQTDHHTCTVNDILFAIQRFQIWRRRESNLTCAVHL